MPLEDSTYLTWYILFYNIYIFLFGIIIYIYIFYNVYLFNPIITLQTNLRNYLILQEHTRERGWGGGRRKEGGDGGDNSTMWWRWRYKESHIY